MKNNLVYLFIRRDKYIDWGRIKFINKRNNRMVHNKNRVQNLQGMSKKIQKSNNTTGINIRISAKLKNLKNLSLKRKLITLKNRTNLTQTLNLIPKKD